MGMALREIALKMNTSYDAVGNAIKRHNLGQYKVVKPVVKKITENLEMEDLNDDNFEELKEQAKLQWKISKTSVPANKKKEFKTWLITSDQHIPHHNESCLKAIFKIMDDIKFDGNVILGDFLDCGVISHWNTNKRKTLELKRLKSDYIIGNAVLDEYDKRLPKNAEKLYLFGNHDGSWIDDLLENMPQLEGLVEPQSQLRLAERGYVSYKYNEIVKLDNSKLYLTHGIYAGGNPVKKHLDETKVNILFGHTHTVASMLSSSPAREVAFSGTNIGCLCDMSPEYMKGKPNAWTHGFAICYVFPDGQFDVHNIRIVNGKFIYNGKVYNGN
jgi:predicted phosphodiesterase